MKHILIFLTLFLISCAKDTKEKKMNFNKKEIYELIDLAFDNKPNTYFPEGNKEDVKYNFFLDLEHGYSMTAGSKIHLYADSTNWAIVLERSGYNNRGYLAEIELNYIGNCIKYPIEIYPERSYITNSSRVLLISPEEYERISNKEGSDMEQFERISAFADEVKVHGKSMKIEHSINKYDSVGIKISEIENPKKLIGYGDLIRYISETNPTLVSATEDEINKHLPKRIPKLMTISEFHFFSIYDKTKHPSQQETFQLISKILLSKDTSFWKPSLKPNNHWSNWDSGNL